MRHNTTPSLENRSRSFRPRHRVSSRSTSTFRSPGLSRSGRSSFPREEAEFLATWTCNPRSNWRGSIKRCFQSLQILALLLRQYLGSLFLFAPSQLSFCFRGFSRFLLLEPLLCFFPIAIFLRFATQTLSLRLLWTRQVPPCVWDLPLC